MIFIKFSDYLWLDSDKLKDVLDSSDDPPSLSVHQSQQQQQQENESQSSQSRKPSRTQQLQNPDVLTNDVEVSERDIEEESPSGMMTLIFFIDWLMEFPNYFKSCILKNYYFIPRTTKLCCKPQRWIGPTKLYSALIIFQHTLGSKKHLWDQW